MSDEYFPNRPSSVLQNIRKIRRICEALPQPERHELFSHMSFLATNLVSAGIIEQGDFTVITQEDQQIFFPNPLPTIKLEHIVCGYVEWLRRKYSLPGFVEVEAGDCVIDCGAFVGGFAMGAATVAASIHAFEPEKANFECLKRNLHSAENSACLNNGLYSHSGTMTLNISSSAVEHSLLAPDNSDVLERVEISVLGLADYCSQVGLKQIDFLKLEAEGVEPEIYEGLGNMRPRKLAIDVSPERDGASPEPFFQDILSRHGYITQRRANVLFARLASDGNKL